MKAYSLFSTLYLVYDVQDVSPENHQANMRSQCSWGKKLVEAKGFLFRGVQHLKEKHHVACWTMLKDRRAGEPV